MRGDITVSGNVEMHTMNIHFTASPPTDKCHKSIEFSLIKQNYQVQLYFGDVQNVTYIDDVGVLELCLPLSYFDDTLYLLKNWPTADFEAVYNKAKKEVSRFALKSVNGIPAKPSKKA